MSTYVNEVMRFIKSSIPNSIEQTKIDDMIKSKKKQWFGQTIIFRFDEDATINENVTKMIRSVQRDLSKLLNEKFISQQKPHGTLLSTIEKDGGYTQEDFEIQKKKFETQNKIGLKKYLEKELNNLSSKYTGYRIDDGGNVSLNFQDVSKKSDSIDCKFREIKANLVEQYNCQAKNNRYQDNITGQFKFKDYFTDSYGIVIGNIISAKAYNDNKDKIQAILDNIKISDKINLDCCYLIDFKNRTLAEYLSSEKIEKKICIENKNCNVIFTNFNIHNNLSNNCKNFKNNNM